MRPDQLGHEAEHRLALPRCVQLDGAHQHPVLTDRQGVPGQEPPGPQVRAGHRSPRVDVQRVLQIVAEAAHAHPAAVAARDLEDGVDIADTPRVEQMPVPVGQLRGPVGVAVDQAHTQRWVVEDDLCRREGQGATRPMVPAQRTAVIVLGHRRHAAEVGGRPLAERWAGRVLQQPRVQLGRVPQCGRGRLVGFHKNIIRHHYC